MHSCYNLILKNIIYMFWAVKVHQQEVSCNVQAMWYNVMSKCTWYYGES